MQKQVILSFLLVLVGQGCCQRRAGSRSSDQVASSTLSPLSSKKEPLSTPIPILRQINEILDDGSYRFGYEGGDGSFRIETRQPDGTVRGKYGFRDADGQIRVVDYSATNETGFDAQGEHIPKGPPPARARPNDFEDEEEAFTTQRPRPKTRPSPRPRPQETQQHRSKPRPRPRPSTTPPPPPPPPPPPSLQNEAFEEEVDDETKTFLLQQTFGATRPRKRPPTPTVITHQLPVHRHQPTTSRRPVFQEQPFDFESAEESPRAQTAVEQSGGKVAVARPVSSSSEKDFPTFDRPFSSKPRRPPPTVDDFLFPSGFQPPRPRPTSRRPKPRPQIEVSPVDTEPIEDFDQLPLRAPRPPLVQQHQLPVHLPHQPRQHQSSFGGSSQGGSSSFIDDFLATHPPPPPRPMTTPRRPVFDEDSFDFRDESRQSNFRDESRQSNFRDEDHHSDFRGERHQSNFRNRDPQSDFRDRSRERARMAELRKAIGTSHGFVFQSKANSDGLDDNVQLIQTVPGAHDPIFHNLGF